MIDQRLINEIEHGNLLAAHGAGEIWNWETPAGQLRWKRRVNMLTSHLKPNMKVLELGCGTGYFTREIVNKNVFLTAIDISDSLLSIAKQNISSDKVQFRIENAYELSFSNNCFDVILGSSVLHHLDINRALKESYRTLKQGGKIFFTEPNFLNPQIFIERNFRTLFKSVSPDESAFLRWSLKTKLTKMGFSKIKIMPFDWLHPLTPEKLINSVNKISHFLENFALVREFSGSLYIEATK